MKRIAGFLKSALIGGFFVILPVALVMFLLREGFESLKEIMAPIVDLIPLEEIAGVHVSTALGIVVLLLICFLAGAAIRTKLGGRVRGWIDTKVLDRIPGCTVLKSMTGQMSGQDETAMFTPAVAMLSEDVHALAFIIEEHDNGFVTVLLPSVPMAMTGMLRYMRADKVRRIDASLIDVADSVRFWGVGSARFFRS